MGIGALGSLSYLLIVASVFMIVLSIVAIVKIIQIAEDLRYIRSKSDVNVQRPKSWKNTLVVCLIVSLIVVIVLFGAMMYR